MIALLMAAIGKIRGALQKAACANSLRQLGVATHLYLMDHNQIFFPYVTTVPEGRLWYFGLEPASSVGGTEGRRHGQL